MSLRMYLTFLYLAFVYDSGSAVLGLVVENNGPGYPLHHGTSRIRNAPYGHKVEMPHAVS
ncbi:hypothetical protein P280DRAFT_472031 [Massarina eburnea CBS 473.64]|uniref:Uncharacterized protein n=1 Tax=Massarina eburnea CBS 473.64 TaxID=1395130 RepID=A0A6A6RT72_9PLEO|nr:hypothetical protein P280DRAFT_472031 [Massarina eburnea CBS 473.64]